MFYRRKILLALVEAFGGSLTTTDCQHLLFLFCSRSEKNYYDFFPDKSGCFSFLAEWDRSQLIDTGLLIHSEGYYLEKHQNFIDQIHINDRIALKALVEEMEYTRDDDLIRYVFLKYPYYATRSDIALQLPEPARYAQIYQNRHDNNSPTLFTIGYEGASIDAYLNTLLANNIHALVDVRNNPFSRKYGFSKKLLANYITKAGMAYFHLPTLGIPSTLRRNLDNLDAYKKLFDHYSLYILPEQSPALAELDTILRSQNRIALTCFEADYHYCHRHRITAYLEKTSCTNIPVSHLTIPFTFDTNIEYTKIVKVPLPFFT